MTAAPEKLTCTDFVDFGKNEDRFARTSWSQVARNDNKYLEIQLKVFRRDDEAEFCKHQQINEGESDFEHFLQLHNPKVVATGEISRKETLGLIETSPLSKDLEEQLRHVQKAITIVD